MAVPAPPAGFRRFLMKTKLGMGRDFRVLDAQTETELFLVDGKVGPRPVADILTAGGERLYTVKGKLMGVPKRMTITDASGAEVAWLKAKAFSIKDRMELDVASGEQWQLVGSFVEKDYTVTSGGRTVVQITQKWITVRDTYTVDVAEGADPGLAFAVVWAVDRWVERD